MKWVVFMRLPIYYALITKNESADFHTLFIKYKDKYMLYGEM